MLPYSFNGLKNVMSVRAILGYNFVPFVTIADRLGDNFYAQFSHAFTNVLQAFTENDHDYLKGIMEPELSAASVAALHSFRDRAETLKYLQDEDANIGQQEPQAIPNVTNLVQLLVKHRKAGMMDDNIEDYRFSWNEKDMKINIDFKGYFGLRIQRSENKGKKFIVFPKSISGRTYFLDTSNPLGIYNNQILVANVIFKTTRRLLALNETGEVIQGQLDQKKWLFHRWQFVTYTPEINWILTDMDDHLGQISPQ